MEPTTASLWLRKRRQASLQSDRWCLLTAAGAPACAATGSAWASAVVMAPPAPRQPYLTRGSSTPYSKSAISVKSTTRTEKTMMIAMMTGVSLA
jgi:hypothetical protein